MKFYIKILLVILITHIYLYSKEKDDLYQNPFWQDLKSILENHPKIKVQILNLSSKMEQYNYKKTFYPDPRFGITWSNVPYNKHLKFQYDKTPMSGIEYSLRQPIPFPGKLTLESKITEKEIELERIKLAESYNKISQEILNTLISYYTWKNIYNLTKNYYNKFKIITVSSKAKYTTGKGTLTDYSKAILLEKKIQEELINYKGLMDNQKENLNYFYSVINNFNYNNDSYNEFILKYIEHLFNSLNKVKKENLIYNTTYYNFAKLLPDLEKQKMDLQEYEYYPDFELFLSYRVREKVPNDPVSGEDFMSAGISFRIPLWSSFSNPAAIKSKEYNLQKSQYNLKNIELNLNTKLSELQIDIKTLQDRIYHYKNILIPQAELSYNSGLQNYTVGKIDFDGLSLILLDLLKLEKEYYLLKKEYYNKLIQYLELSNHILPEIIKTKSQKENHYENE
ncbi:MAG: hypothetical protein KatS3mg129_1612 [Leptospiraceae bacterium]|nr:MAG: hypothetical protein KatS3mg129_1612 [Leptospiraceae bacterium]